MPGVGSVCYPPVTPLLAGDAVDRLAEQVGVPRVPGGLLDQVQQHPAQGERLAILERSRRRLVKARGLGDDGPAALARVPVALPDVVAVQRDRGAELPVRV